LKSMLRAFKPFGAVDLCRLKIVHAYGCLAQGKKACMSLKPLTSRKETRAGPRE
jgi:hypothetical protein